MTENLPTSYDSCLVPMPYGTLTTQPGGEMSPGSQVQEIVGSQLENEGLRVEEPLLTEPVPPGLACLATADRLIIRKVSKTMKRYDVWVNNERVYYAFEDSKLCEECCCCQDRSFVIRIKNNAGQDVIRMARPSRCCCGDSVDISADPDTCTIEAPIGKVIGFVVMNPICFGDRCSVKDANNRLILKIDKADYFGCSTVEFQVTTRSDRRIGGIKKRSGWSLETHFVVQFPSDLETKTKALLLGAAFFMDVVQFDYDFC